MLGPAKLAILSFEKFGAYEKGTTAAARPPGSGFNEAPHLGATKTNART